MAETRVNSPKSIELFNRAYSTLVEAATAAEWDTQNPAVRLLSQISTHEDFVSLGSDAGISNENLIDTISQSGMASLSMLTSDRDASSFFFDKSNELMGAILNEQEDVVLSIAQDPANEGVSINTTAPTMQVVEANTEAPVLGASSGVALAYFERYQRVVQGVVEDGAIDFEPSTVADMREYGADEPSIIYAGTMAGQDFYGFMTSPESVELVRQGIMENVDLADQSRQLEILDLLKVDANRMEREFSRAMDGPIADAQAEHLAFARTVNPADAEEVLETVGANHDIVERMADGIVMSMPEIDVLENFTAPVDIDPTIPTMDTTPSLNAAPLLATPADGADSIPVAENTTPVLPPEEVVLAAAEVVAEEPVIEEPESTTYDIQEGDTLSAIVAEHYGLTEWDDIQRVYETVARNNGIEDPDLIYTGNSLVLFDNPTVDLFPEECASTVSSDCVSAFNASAEGLVAANSPEEPVIRPMPRPADLLAPAA